MAEASGAPRSSSTHPAPSDAAEANPPPAPSALAALSRFEFEAEKGNDGTKVLLVEWQPPAALSSSSSGDWDVSWQGKGTYVTTSDSATNYVKRLYFLLPPGVAVPPSVTISHPDGPTLTAKPLPAIFIPNLGADSSDAGKRGVLHTIWATKRLADLQQEIDEEMKSNAESVGLEMALQERFWLVDHFGLAASGAPALAPVPASLPPMPTPLSPKSPVGGRLGEKLRGLKLATSAADLAASPTGKPKTAANAQRPASSLNAKQSAARTDGQGIESLEAVLRADGHGAKETEERDSEDLFALPMSPRSPEMKRSPFSLL